MFGRSSQSRAHATGRLTHVVVVVWGTDRPGEGVWVSEKERKSDYYEFCYNDFSFQLKVVLR